MKIYNVPTVLDPYIKDDTIIVRSPGRINLLGEHTDYNQGLVLPAAIDKAVYLTLTPRNDEQICLYAVDLGESYTTSVQAIVKATANGWPNYLLGVVEQFMLAGIALKGFDAALTADIPIGAGLSSSAAVECAVATALNAYSNAGFDKLALVKMAQKAENEYVGVQCGIMDQFASMFGKKNQVIKLDCRTLEYEYEPFNMDGIKIVLFDTGVKHSLESSEYNVRRKQCEAGVALIRKHLPGIASLRDATVDMLNKYVLSEDIHTYLRCRYVVEENERLINACKDLENDILTAFGSRMYETHFGLSKMYEVSCKELDFLVDFVSHKKDVLGARMMGGGFGGCTINIVKEEAVAALIEEVAKAYREATALEMKAYVVHIEDGTSILHR